jgi:rubrerythrin
MAVTIEKNGEAFYNKAAANTKDKEAKQQFLSLAAMEVAHAGFFNELKTNLAAKEKEQNTYDPYNEGVLYLNAFAGGYVFKKDKNPADELTGNESVEDILSMAIGLEKDSIVFYLGIKDMVPESLGKDKIQNIIKEEMSHIRLLSEQMRKLA